MGRREKINFRGADKPSVVVQVTKPHNDLPEDFQGRLQAYLDEEDEKKKWRKQKKGRRFKTKKRRRKRKKKESDDDEESDEEDEDEDARSAVDGDMYIDPRLL